MSAYTKGPWNIHPAYPIDSEILVATNDNGESFMFWHGVVARDKKIICEVQMRKGQRGGFPVVGDVEEARANVRLILAAPELLEALKDVMAGAYNARQHEDCTDCNFKRALAAIAEAEGL